MSALLSERATDWINSRGRWLLLLAGPVELMRALLPQLQGPGLVSTWMMAWLGACCMCLRSWRTERGLWMLSGFFLLVMLAGLAMPAVGTARDTLAGREVLGPLAADPWDALDVGVTLALMVLQAVLLLTVTVRNLALTTRVA